VRAAYSVLFRAAVATLPPRVSDVVAVRARPGDLQVGRAAVTVLRFMLGSSPDWRLALLRTRSPAPPEARFRQPLPVTPSTG
jgi:hypothetical protein